MKGNINISKVKCEDLIKGKELQSRYTYTYNLTSAEQVQPSLKQFIINCTLHIFSQIINFFQLECAHASA